MCVLNGEVLFVFNLTGKDALFWCKSQPGLEVTVFD